MYYFFDTACVLADPEYVHNQTSIAIYFGSFLGDHSGLPTGCCIEMSPFLLIILIDYLLKMQLNVVDESYPHGFRYPRECRKRKSTMLSSHDIKS